MDDYSYITPEGRVAASMYKYNGSDNSLLYKYALSPFAQFCVNNFTPLWMAPNLITLIGLLLCVLANATTWYHSPDMDNSSVPNWVWALCAACLFAYQTLDNMDGKQARRTQSSSSLGLLFDHGCDALHAGVLGPLTLAAMLQSGGSWLTFTLWVITASTFYVATWEEFHVDTLILPIVNGPSDGLVITCITYLIGFWYGTEFWSAELSQPITIPLLNITISTVGQAPVFLTGTVAAMTIVGQILTVVRTVRHSLEETLRAIGRLAPMVILGGCGAIWIHLNEELFKYHARVFLLTMGFVFTDISSKLMVSHVCQQKFRPNWFGIVGFCFGPLNAILREHGGSYSQLAWPKEYDLLILWCTCAVSATFLVRFIVYAVNELADALEIRVFKIPYKDDKTE